MKIFIICYLLFIHVNMCIYMFIESPYYSYYVVIQSGFRVSIRILGAGLVLGWIITWISIRCCFGFWFWVSRYRLRCTKTPPNPNRNGANCHPYSLCLYLLANWLGLSWLSMCTLGSKLSCKLGLHHGSFGLERFGSRTSPSHNN